MSNFRKLTRHPKTDKLEVAEWLDDYFGHYHYGVRFPSDRIVYTEEEVKEIKARSNGKN